MWVPLFVLAAGAVLLSIVGTPAWPWFERWIEGESAFLGSGMGFDAFYEKAVIGPLAFLAGGIDALERQVFVPLMGLGELVLKRCGIITRSTDDCAINGGFDRACDGLRQGAASSSQSQSGRPQGYLRAIGLTATLLLLLYFWLSDW
jgi:NADH-quinone oxidoreductase subunit L